METNKGELMLDTPVLLLVFNRPDTTAVVLNKLKEVKPKQLFVAADGPRAGNEKDTVRCKEVRDLILNEVDWDCELKTRFNDRNLGCGHNPAQAITWFFEHVEQGIILEDDVNPSLSFFTFCSELLDKYKFSTDVMKISGNNFLDDYTIIDSYLFSNFAGNWGWATWKRAWEGYDYKIQNWGSKTFRKKFKKRFSKNQYTFFENIFNLIYFNDRDDIWDYQWWFHRLKNNGIDIIPKYNLVQNIGFNSDATHTVNGHEDLIKMQAKDLKFPLSHPSDIKVNKEYDNLLSIKYYSSSKNSILSILKNKVKKYLKVLK